MNSVPSYGHTRNRNPGGENPSSSSSDDDKGWANKRNLPGSGNPGRRARENPNIIPVTRDEPIQFGSKSYMKPPILSHEANPHDHGLWKSKFKGWFVDGGGTLCSPSQQLTILTTCLNGDLTTKMYALYRHESIPVYKTGEDDRCMMDGLDYHFIRKYPLHSRRSHLIQMKNPEGMLDSTFASQFIQACEDAYVFDATVTEILSSILATKIKNKDRREKIILRPNADLWKIEEKLIEWESAGTTCQDGVVKYEDGSSSATIGAFQGRQQQQRQGATKQYHNVPQVPDSQSDAQRRNCHRCNSKGHVQASCPYKNKECGICGRTGHANSACRTRKSDQESFQPRQNQSRNYNRQQSRGRQAALTAQGELYSMDQLENVDEDVDGNGRGQPTPQPWM